MSDSIHYINEIETNVSQEHARRKEGGAELPGDVIWIIWIRLPFWPSVHAHTFSSSHTWIGPITSPYTHSTQVILIPEQVQTCVRVAFTFTGTCGTVPSADELGPLPAGSLGCCTTVWVNGSWPIYIKTYFPIDLNWKAWNSIHL